MTIATGEQALASDLVDGANMPTGAIIIWTGTIANIPSGWLICDGNNGTPNLLTRFLEGVATAATDPGATGGATTKTTGTPSATDACASDNVIHPAEENHTHSITDIRPLYYDVAYLMKS